MKYLKIKSKGTIDIKAFTLLGGSTKRQDSSKIGMFGSGLKYAISSMLRNNISFKVYSGEDEIKFTTSKSNFRETEFEIISINGQETSFTTSMGGKDWDIPFAPLREIYSNALDEDEDAEMCLVDTFDNQGDYTCFYIEYTESVKDFHTNLNQYFCNKNPHVLFSNKHGSVFRAHNDELRLFRKGILAKHDDKQKAVYSYNSPNFTINESRVLTSEHTAKRLCGNIWKLCQNKRLIYDFLNYISGGNAGLYEHNISFSSYWLDEVKFNDTWREIVEENKFIAVEHLMVFSNGDARGRMALPLRLLKALRNDFEDIDIKGMNFGEDDEMFIEITPNELLMNKVVDSIAFLNNTDYKYKMTDISVKYVRFENEDVYGLAKDKTIYLSEKLIDKSVSEVAKIIIEENEHNRTGFGDETRSFQNHLFDLFFEQLIK